MAEPTIMYGNLQQPLHSNAQYLLMQASMGNGTYATRDFIEAIKRVSLENIANQKCKHDLEIQRTFLSTMAAGVEMIAVRDFQPDRKRLEKFVNTTFDDILVELYAQPR